MQKQKNNKKKFQITKNQKRKKNLLKSLYSLMLQIKVSNKNKLKKWNPIILIQSKNLSRKQRVRNQNTRISFKDKECLK